MGGSDWRCEIMEMRSSFGRLVRSTMLRLRLISRGVATEGRVKNWAAFEICLKMKTYTYILKEENKTKAI
jgi:hypothetical protein